MRAISCGRGEGKRRIAQDASEATKMLTNSDGPARLAKSSRGPAAKPHTDGL